MQRVKKYKKPSFEKNIFKASFFALNSYAFRFYLILIIASLSLWTLVALGVARSFEGNQKKSVLSNINNEIVSLTRIKEEQGRAALIQNISTLEVSYSLYSYYYLYVDKEGTRLAGELKSWPVNHKERDGYYYFDIPLASYFEPEKGTTNVLAMTHKFEDGSALLVAHSTRIFSIYGRSYKNAAIIALSIALPLGFISALFTAYLTQREFSSLNKSILRIMAGDLNERIDITASKVESRDLSENLNKMLDTISLLMEDVRRVSDNIAHDLNTPLSRLHNNIKKLIEESPDDQKEKLEILLEECNDILATFNALLLVAKIESSSSTIEKQPISIETIINDVVELYEPLADNNGIRISTSLKNANNILADRNLIFQIIANIVDNSIKYSDADSQINISVKDGIFRQGTCTLDALDYESIQELSTSKKEQKTHETKHYLSVVISDCGVGIPNHSHKKIFQRFYREEKSRGLKPGNGLGLSMVMAVMQIHEGAIYVNSLSPGLSITLVLPTAAKS